MDLYYQESQQITAKLLDNDLWRTFHKHETEMIITKSGRCMFPVIKIELAGLNASSTYDIIVEFVLVDNCRLKYTPNKGWLANGQEEPQLSTVSYKHKDSPNTGQYWMSNPLSFKSIKLTNTLPPPEGQIVLNSMYKYQPIIKIYELTYTGIYSRYPLLIKSLTFPETRFIAVTAYQNEDIKILKIDNNPFAKGFRINGKGKRKREFDTETKKSSSEVLTSNSNASTSSDIDSANEDRFEPSSQSLSSPGTSSTSSLCNSAVVFDTSYVSRRPNSHSAAQHIQDINSFYSLYHFKMSYRMPTPIPQRSIITTEFTIDNILKDGPLPKTVQFPAYQPWPSN